MTFLQSFNVKQKIIGGFVILGATSLLASGIGLSGTSKLSDNLSFITGPAWDTADGAMESTINIQLELITVENIISGKPLDLELSHLKTYQQEGDEAFQRLLQAGIMNQNEIQGLERQLKEYRQIQDQLIREYQRYENALHNFDQTKDRFVEFGEIIEGIGDGAVEELEQNPQGYYQWQSEIAPRWAAADECLSNYFRCSINRIKDLRISWR